MTRERYELDGGTVALVVAGKIRAESYPWLPWRTLGTALAYGLGVSAWVGVAAWFLR